MSAGFHPGYDVVIVGGGVAGSATAITVARSAPRARVLLLERGRYPRHKVCGEFLSPEGVRALCLIGGESKNLKYLLQTAPKIEAARLYIDKQIVAAPIHPAAVSLTRFNLDDLLWRLAESLGVECRQEVSVDQVEKTDLFYLEATDGKVRSRTLVNASGRWSILTAASVMKERNQATKWIGLKAHFMEKSPHASVDLYFFDGGYCGVQPVSPDRLNVCAMVRADMATNLEQVFALHPKLHRRRRHWQLATEPVSTSPLLFRKPDAVYQGVLNVGDAAGFIDPFVGDGITLALRSGVMAGEWLSSAFRGRCDLDTATQKYREHYERELGPTFLQASRVRGLIGLPRILRVPLVAAMRIPGVSRRLVKQTRSDN